MKTLLASLTPFLFLALSSPANELHVGEGQPYATPSAAAKVAKDGDTVIIHEGKYLGDVCAWNANDLTVKGENPETTIISAAGEICMGKAVWVFTGRNCTVEGVTIRGAKCPENNGSAIFLEGCFSGLCTISNCVFSKNDDGIRCGQIDDCELLLEDCKFFQNGAGDGLSHNIYVGNIRKVTARRVISDHARKGHAFKSRAKENILEHCRFDDGEDGECAYLADFPNGGKVSVTDCYFRQSNNASNSGLVAYGMEGNLHAENYLIFKRNTMINLRENGARFVMYKGIEEPDAEDNTLEGKGSDRVE